MLISRGARINATNMGDDTALHLAAAHGHRDIVMMVCIIQAFKDQSQVSSSGKFKRLN